MDDRHGWRKCGKRMEQFSADVSQPPTHALKYLGEVCRKRES